MGICYICALWYTSSPTFVCNTAVMECVPSLSDKSHAQTSRPALHVAFKENEGKTVFEELGTIWKDNTCGWMYFFKSIYNIPFLNFAIKKMTDNE